MDYNQALAAALKGRFCPHSQFSFMGSALGFSEEDVHANRFYTIFLRRSPQNQILEITVKVEGDLISPCSGYFPEILDEFDFEPVLQYCFQMTDVQQI